MIPLALGAGRTRLSLLCIGAHSDDIEIGAGGLILSLLASGLAVDVHWCVLSANGVREDEARASAADFLAGAASRTVDCGRFEDSLFPSQSPAIKAWLADVRSRFAADVVLVHGRDDAHQDHRELSALAWNLFRDQLILEYEIPKWDGDLGRPNAYAALEPAVLERKIELLERHFGSQRSKDWFDADTFRGLARLRGMECRAPGRFAEAFTLRKLRLL
ncbi:PIG-L deacetylase family protein [Oceaniglobus roseus]|uniref:PIG-L deacetylase family protein n=1 Tax=Oceaniglobus roseus TaxID=1737570 RepID=UPI000C7F0F05|nr:PIG-L deacetylase family protein [Kandeliimicrobium roseum]